MIEALADMVEMNGLVMTANKRGYLADARAKLKAGVASMATAAGLNGPPATATMGDDESGITNRSPRTDTTNNNYPVRSDAPWVALIALIVLLIAAGLGWLIANQPARPTPIVSPVPTPTPTVPPVAGTNKSNPDYIEFYRPF